MINFFSLFHSWSFVVTRVHFQTTDKLSSILHLSWDHWKLYFTNSAQKSGFVYRILVYYFPESPRVPKSPRPTSLSPTSPSPTSLSLRVPKSKSYLYVPAND